MYVGVRIVDMKKFKMGFILMYCAIGLVFGFIALAMILSAIGGVLPQWMVAVCLTIVVVMLVLISVSVWLISGAGTIIKKRRLYKNMPYMAVKSYKDELDKMRENFAADTSANKNTIPRPLMGKNTKPYFDFNALKNGRVYYGCLVEGNTVLFTKGNLNNYMLPAVFVYSTDEYYEEDPLALGEIAENLYNNRRNNILRDERNYFSNVVVDDPACCGRKVYMTTVMVYRPLLPTGYITDGLIPLVADPEHSQSAFVLEDKYWSKTFACNYVNKGNERKFVQSEIDAYNNYPVTEVENYAYDLAAVKENFLADVDDYEEDEDGGEPFGELGKENKQGRYSFYYACVLSVDKKINDPFSKQGVFPAIIIYGEDEEFRYNPRGLEGIAAIINGLDEKERKENFKLAVDMKKHTVADVRVPPEWTDGRQVFLSGVVISRRDLPKLSVTDCIMPVVRSNKDGVIYSINKDYWTKGLISQFVRGVSPQPSPLSAKK